MAVCGVCKKPSGGENDVECSGSCGFVFHTECIKGEFDKKTRATKSFKCRDCRSTSSQASVKAGSSVTEVITKDFILKVMEGFKKEVCSDMEGFKKELLAEIVTFRTEVNELSSSLQFMSDKMDESCKMMENLTVQFTQLKKENEEIRSNNLTLSNEVRELRERVRNLEQYSRANNIEVSGLPVTRDECVNDLVKDLGAAIGVEVESGDVSTAHRVPSYRKDREPALIVQFTNRTKRDEWITKYRLQKTSLTAQQVNKQFPTQRVYINDHLSPENKQLLSKLKQKCRDIGYEFAWCRDAKFFARKAKGEPARRITSFEDIENLK